MPRKTTPFPRYLAPRLREALADTPAVLRDAILAAYAEAEASAA